MTTTTRYDVYGTRTSTVPESTTTDYDTARAAVRKLRAEGWDTACVWSTDVAGRVERVSL